MTAGLVAAAVLFLMSCTHGKSRANGGTGLSHGGAGPSVPAPIAARPGMVYVPAGTLLAGSRREQTPRVAEEELPGTPIELGPFYIDELPYPDEAGAIATTNVTRDEAAALCSGKGKRLCSELEWERACKGPTNTTYEDGNAFHPATCGLGVSADISSKRPTGELEACVSGFGMREPHGGAWEWTDQPWGRGGRRDLGVLKGGNSVAGELAGRCANSLARPPTTKSPSMGFRCCAGPETDAAVDLAVKTGAALERTMKTAELTGPWLSFAQAEWPPRSSAGTPFAFVHAFVWRPVGNETLVVASGCARDEPHPRCGLLVARPDDGDSGSPRASSILLHVDTGYEAAEVAEAGEARHLRFKGLDATSAYLRDFTYSYGRVELADVRR